MFNVINAIKIPSFVYWTILVIVLIVVLIVVLAITSKHIAEKRKKDCFNLLNKVCNSKETKDYRLEYSTNPKIKTNIEKAENNKIKVYRGISAKNEELLKEYIEQFINGDLFHHKFMSNSDVIMYALLFVDEIVKLCIQNNATLVFPS